MGRGTPARYRRIIEEYVVPILRTVEAPTEVVYENRIESLIRNYMLTYATDFVHSSEGEKAERQFRYVYTVVTVKVADLLMRWHSTKLEKALSQIRYILRTYRHEFAELYTTYYMRKPSATVLSIYDSFIDHLLHRRTIGDIAEMHKISVATCRNYLRQIRTIINEIILEHVNESPELSRIYETCMRLNMPNILLVPRGIFGSRFWRDVEHMRLRTIWHVFAVRCTYTMLGVSCDSYSTELCYEYHYMVTAPSLLHACLRDNWQLLDICHSEPLVQAQRTYRYRAPVPDTLIGLYLTFVDAWEWYTFVPSRDRTATRYRMLIRKVCDIGRRVIAEKYHMPMLHKCFE